MNIEDYREFCLSLGEDVEEKLPFSGFHCAVNDGSMRLKLCLHTVLSQACTPPAGPVLSSTLSAVTFTTRF